MSRSRQTRADFDRLAAAAQRCRRCPAMEGRRRLLSRANGQVSARIMLIGEAPGRLGAERTGVPFAGDQSGKRLDRLIAAAGWTRDDLFITNAVLCNPQDRAGRNRPPASIELANCRPWLQAQIDLIDPLLVVALGAAALGALRALHPHDLSVRDAGKPPVPWNGRWLAAVYHPSARASIHRPFEAQVEDFRRLGGRHRTHHQDR